MNFLNTNSLKSRDLLWAEQIRDDNKLAFSHLFDAYYEPLCDYAYRYVKHSEIMEDIVQEVFVRIWEKRKHWKPMVSVRAYLYRSVYNEIVTDFRKRRFETHYEDFHDLEQAKSCVSPLDELHDRETARAIGRAIEMLPDRRKEILVLRLLQGLSYKEISAILDISVNTVDTQIRRALKLLRIQLKDFALDPDSVRA